MKQKVVVKVTVNDQKGRSKALKIAVSVSAVESAALQGADKNQIEVTGDGIDAVELTTLLRKSVGHAELVSVGPVKKEETATTVKKNEAAVQFPWVVSTSYYPTAGVTHYPVYEVPNSYESSPSCSIM